jgi:hypothetical protein
VSNVPYGQLLTPGALPSLPSSDQVGELRSLHVLHSHCTAAHDIVPKTKQFSDTQILSKCTEWLFLSSLIKLRELRKYIIESKLILQVLHIKIQSGYSFNYVYMLCTTIN